MFFIVCFMKSIAEKRKLELQICISDPMRAAFLSPLLTIRQIINSTVLEREELSSYVVM